MTQPLVPVLALWIVLGSGLCSAATVVGGSEQSTLLVPAGIQVEPYANDGYRLEVDGDSVRIEVRADPLGSTAPVPRGPAFASGPAARVARGVTAGATTQYEAVSRVLAWIARQIRYELDRTESQEPEAVLARRSAYCTGVARLAVAMLGGLGIETREVAGYVVSDTGAGGEFHRWIEVHYPDRGWVFSDPVRSHHFVPSNYLRLASDQADREASGSALVLSRESGLREIDQWSAAPGGIRLRSNDGRQRMAALVVGVDRPLGEGQLVLSGAGRRWALPIDASGSAIFLGLELGEYRLDWSAGDRIVASKQVRFRAPVRAVVRLVGSDPLASQGAGKR